jgi:hypothetical protein
VVDIYGKQTDRECDLLGVANVAGDVPTALTLAQLCRPRRETHIGTDDASQ